MKIYIYIYITPFCVSCEYCLASIGKIDKYYVSFAKEPPTRNNILQE